MAYHEHLHQAFLDAHGASADLAGTWRNPTFGDEVDEKMLRRTAERLCNAATHIHMHLENQKVVAE